MTKSIPLRVDVVSDTLIITFPGTTFRVLYRKLSHEPGLMAFDMQGDREASISMAHFLSRAWQVANNKARELGWIV